jgi:hypothetical protein
MRLAVMAATVLGLAATTPGEGKPLSPHGVTIVLAENAPPSTPSATAPAASIDVEPIRHGSALWRRLYVKGWYEPKTVLAAVRVGAAGREMEIPRAALADLEDPHVARFRLEGERWALTIVGGDGANSYQADFSPTKDGRIQRALTDEMQQVRRRSWPVK